MKIKEWIKDNIDIEQVYSSYGKDPIQQVIDADFLDFDAIVKVDGKLQKVVYYNDTDYITVVDLLLLKQEDIDAEKQSDLYALYKAYMSNIEIDDMTLEKLFDGLKEYKEIQAEKDKEREKLCSE